MSGSLMWKKNHFFILSVPVVVGLSAAQSVNPQGVSMWFETYALLSVEISATVFTLWAGFTYRKLYLTEKGPILLTWFVVRKEMNTTACFLNIF